MLRPYCLNNSSPVVTGNGCFPGTTRATAVVSAICRNGRRGTVSAAASWRDTWAYGRYGGVVSNQPGRGAPLRAGASAIYTSASTMEILARCKCSLTRCATVCAAATDIFGWASICMSTSLTPVRIVLATKPKKTSRSPQRSRLSWAGEDYSIGSRGGRVWEVSSGRGHSHPLLAAREILRRAPRLHFPRGRARAAVSGHHTPRW